MSSSNTGQVCHATTRILVPESTALEATTALIENISSLKIGDPRDPAVEIGPLVSAAHRTRVEQHIETARTEGATLALGGRRPAIERGWYVEPTMFVDVKPAMHLAQEEVFGPVLAVLTYTDVDDAVQLANDSRYGLGGAVYGSDHDLCLR